MLPLSMPTQGLFYGPPLAHGVGWHSPPLAPISMPPQTQQHVDGSSAQQISGGLHAPLSDASLDSLQLGESLPVEQSLPAADGSSPALVVQSVVDEPLECGLQIATEELGEIYEGTLDELCADYARRT